MTYDRYFRYGLTEVANNPRVAAYVRNGIEPVGAIINTCDECESLAEAVGDGVYDSPLIDEPPWFSEEDVDTVDFAGVNIVEVTGLAGATTIVEVQERVGDGGLVGSRRDAARVVGVTADLVGRTPAATAVGLEWLTAALHPPCAASGGCGGETLHLFSACPETCDGQTDPDALPVASALANTLMTVEVGEAAEVTPATRTNLATHPSFELDSNADGLADGWNAENGGTNGGITREVVAYNVTSGAKAQRIVSSGQDNQSTSFAGVYTNALPLSPGAAYARVDVAALLLPVGHKASFYVDCRNASNTILQTFGAHRQGEGSGTLEVEFTAPAGTTNVVLRCRHTGTGSGDPTAVRVETVWDSLLLVQGEPMDYYDGDSVDNAAYTFAWSGTPHASTSTATGTGDWLEFTYAPISGDEQPGRIISDVLPGVCDEVTAAWAVAATDVNVSLLLLDSAGRVAYRAPAVYVNGTTSLTVTVNPSPGFPGDWRMALEVDGDVLARGAVTSRPILTLEQCVSPYRRTLRNVVTVEGPKVVAKHTLGDTTDGSTVWRVEWTWVALSPHLWHDTTPLLTSVPSGGGAAAYTAPGITLSTAGNVNHNDTTCARPAVTFDNCGANPNLSSFLLPPQAPVIADPAVMSMTGGVYTRRWAEIPSDLMPLGLGALTWAFSNDGSPKLGVRVRVYVDTDPAAGPQLGEECDFVQEFYIDYLGPDQILHIDGPGGQAYIECGDDAEGNPIYVPADRNLRGDYGGPFVPLPVGCNRAYLVVVDVPQTYRNQNPDGSLAGFPNGTAQGSLGWTLAVTRRG